MFNSEVAYLLLISGNNSKIKLHAQNERQVAPP